MVASGVTFRVVLAVFPAVALLVWLGTRTIGQQEANALTTTMSGFVPDSTRRLIAQMANTSLHKGLAARKDRHDLWEALGPYIGLLFSLWSTNGGMKALFNAINVIYDEEERRSFLRFNLLTFLFTLGTLAIITVATSLVVAAPLLASLMGLSSVLYGALGVLRWPVLFAVFAIALAFLYRVAPNRTRRHWPLVTVGSVVASFGIVLGSALFNWFVTHVGSLTATYGSLSTMVAFMLWLWLAFWLVLTCAELDSCIERESGLYSGEPRPSAPA